MVRFVDVIADVLTCTTWSSMGTDVADLDGDGLLDLMVADMSATHFKAKVNMGEMEGGGGSSRPPGRGRRPEHGLSRHRTG